MLMKKKRFVSIAAAVLATCLIAGCGNSAKPAGNSAAAGGDAGKKTTLKIGTITKADGQLSITMKNIGDELKTKSNGRFEPRYFFGGELGNETDMMQQLNTGSIQMAMITTAQLSNSSPAFGAWLMPYLVDNHEQAYKLWTSPESMALFDTLKNDNVVGLGYISSGFRYILGTKPVQSAKDLEGYKIRTTPSPTILEYWNGLKASPTPMALTEVYTSLQTGVIKGIDIDSESILPEKLTEIAKYLTPDKHMYWAGAVLVNKDVWNGMSAEDKKLLQDIVLSKTKENSETVSKNEQKLLGETASKLGLTVNELKRDEVESAVKSVRSNWSAKQPEIAKFLDKAEQIKQGK